MGTTTDADGNHRFYVMGRHHRYMKDIPMISSHSFSENTFFFTLKQEKLSLFQSLTLYSTMSAEPTFEGWCGLDAESAKGNMKWQTYEAKTWEETDIDIEISHW